MVQHTTRLHDDTMFFSTCRGGRGRGWGCCVGVALRSSSTSFRYFLPSVAPAPRSRGVAPSAGRKQVGQFEFGPGRLDDGHLPHHLCVTKNPRSPQVWSAGESSRGGRGGSRSRAQSSLCLEGEALSQSLPQTEKQPKTQNPLTSIHSVSLAAFQLP